MLTADEVKRLDNCHCELERAGAFTDLRTELLATNTFIQTYSPVIIQYAIADDAATAALPAFTAPFAMVIDRIDLLTTVGEADNTVKVMKGAIEMCAALVAITAKVITSMATSVESAVKTLAAGDVVNVQAAGGSNGDKQRGILTFYGHRV